MKNARSNNSILVLATLGVYLGLVLAGATPQVLAQAAMTREFSVKDEIEVKDDLDKNPDNVTADPADATTPEIHQKVTRSVERFIANFRSVNSINSLCSIREPGVDSGSFHWRIIHPPEKDRFNHSIPLSRIVVVTNLARADLEPLFA